MDENYIVDKKKVNQSKLKYIKRVMSYLFIKKKTYWIERIQRAKTLDAKFNIALKIDIGDLGKNETVIDK